ncbi:MAG: glycosyltransferase family 2 protein [Clostridia bacterium]|nr:glycosyltransferase family 2 protein [Clostridia bacterium]
MNTFNNHTFVICAYKESKYLEECIKSLKNQTVKSNIIISTSTPNDYIKNLSIKYNLEYFVNLESNGIGSDWNFAVEKASTTAYVTVAHQDDIYNETYTENIIKTINKYNDIIMIFTDCKEIRNRKISKKEY